MKTRILIGCGILILSISSVLFWAHIHGNFSNAASLTIREPQNLSVDDSAGKITFTAAEAKALVERALKSALAAGCRFKLAGQSVAMKKIEGVVCIHTDTGHGTQMIVNREGMFATKAGVTYRLDYMREMLNPAFAQITQAGTPEFNKQASYRFLGTTPDGSGYLIEADLSDDALMSMAQSFNFAKFEQVFGTRLTPEQIVQQIPASQIYTITHDERLLSVEKRNMEGELLKGSLSVDQSLSSSAPVPDEWFAISDGIPVVPIASQKELMAAVKQAAMQKAASESSSTKPDSH
jgi:hypothetical protein